MKTSHEDHFEPEIVPGLRREWMILARRRRMIVAIVVLALAGAAAYNYSVKPLYTGSAIISAGESMPGQPYARLNTDIPRLKAVIDKEIARITSRELAMEIVKQLGPKERAELASGALGPWYSRLRFPGEAPVPESVNGPNTALAVNALRSRLRVDWREPSTWIDIRLTGYDPEAVAGLANAIARTYVTETAEANRQTIENSSAEIDTQLKTKERQLGEQLSAVRDIAAETGLGDLNARKAVLERQIRGFQDALVAAQTARVGRTATSREAAQMEGGGLASDARILAAQTRVSELEDRERALLSTLGEQHPEVITLREQLKAARARLDATTAAVEKSADSAYQLAVKEEERIEANLQRVQRELSNLEKQSLNYSLTQKRADASRVAVDQLIQRQELQATIIIQAEVIQTAFPPPVPSSPQKRENFTYALAGGLLAGILLAWMLERFDDTIQSPDDIKDILGLPFLGVVPLVPKLRDKTIAAALADTRTGFSDGLRVVRTNLMFGAPQLKPKVLVFTSASPGDGKSTVASGIALLLNETQARVLLIDGDLRRPSIHALLEVPAGPGLSDLLALSGPVALAVSPGPFPGVDVLPAGPPLTVSAARLGSENMRSLLAQARERYDWIIIDSPPSLGLPDASVLATMADAVVVVCSGDKTPRQALRSVNDQLRSVGARLLGVVLNRVNMDRHSYYYGRYYSAYYGDEDRTARTGAAEGQVAPAARAE
ncbi:MAG: polysaccharide biosynthesis tyrosine autokinase [Vicinamibacteria bacterium]|nr:polysaccharide biosynthesis tyrosine autokinase [Vicinamibacteria bacterium]